MLAETLRYDRHIKPEVTVHARPVMFAGGFYMVSDVKTIKHLVEYVCKYLSHS